ncbi:MAG TPA: TlpA disulfide reductase family protein [Gaiellaceae bacterium]|nr:TlpA disulfide reductase family protein [Gaiellaceae bacterium]
MRGLKLAGQLGALALVLALLGLLVWKVVSDAEPAARVGERAPRFSLPRLEDEDNRAGLHSYPRSVRVVNFWATWCAPCREEAPLLQAAWEKYRSRGVVVIGVDTRDFVSDARGFVDRYELTYPNVYDGSGSLVEPWGVTGFPETFVIGRDGVIVDHIVGAIDDAEQIESAIEAAL